MENVPETYLEKWASIILLCLRLRHRYVIRDVENVISKCRHYYKLTCIQAHFVADACQRCLSAVGVSVTGTPNVAQHGFVLPQINNPLYFTVLYLFSDIICKASNFEQFTKWNKQSWNYSTIDLCKSDAVHQLIRW